VDGFFKDNPDILPYWLQYHYSRLVGVENIVMMIERFSGEKTSSYIFKEDEARRMIAS